MECSLGYWIWGLSGFWPVGLNILHVLEDFFFFCFFFHLSNLSHSSCPAGCFSPQYTGVYEWQQVDDKFVLVKVAHELTSLEYIISISSYQYSQGTLLYSSKPSRTQQPTTLHDMPVLRKKAKGTISNANGSARMQHLNFESHCSK